MFSFVCLLHYNLLYSSSSSDGNSSSINIYTNVVNGIPVQQISEMLISVDFLTERK